MRSSHGEIDLSSREFPREDADIFFRNNREMRKIADVFGDPPRERCEGLVSSPFFQKFVFPKTGKREEMSEQRTRSSAFPALAGTRPLKYSNILMEVSEETSDSKSLASYFPIRCAEFYRFRKRKLQRWKEGCPDR